MEDQTFGPEYVAMPMLGPLLVVVPTSFVFSVTFTSAVVGQTSGGIQAATMIDSVYITAIPRSRQRWFTGQYLGGSIGVRIRNVGPQECLRRVVTFTPLTAAVVSGADVKAQAVGGQWNGSACHASMRWRLSDVPGDQRLQARLQLMPNHTLSDSAVINNAVDFTAVAHAPGSLFIGAAYVPGGIEGVSGTDSIDVQRKERAFQAIIGFELPLVVSLRSKPGLLDNIRVSAATSLRDLGADLYTGISLFPIFTGARGGAFPLQASIGSRIGFKSHGNAFFISLHYNASGALTTALGLVK